MNDYIKYRGKCKELVDNLCKKDPTLTPVRGHYICWSWGKQAHWWATKPDGTIVDPSVDQFPKPHIGEYLPFNGIVLCAECDKQIPEERAIFYGKYPFCSGKCKLKFFGIFTKNL